MESGKQVGDEQHIRDQLLGAQEENQRLKHRLASAERRLGESVRQVQHYRTHPFYQLGYAAVQVFTAWNGLFLFPKRFLKALQDARVLRRRARVLRNPRFPVKALVKRPWVGDRRVFPMPVGLENPDVPVGDFLAALKNLRVAAIMDPMTANMFGPECDLQAVYPDSFETLFVSFRPQLLFVESAWDGSGGAWHNRINHPGEHLERLLAWCREHQVPTVFWNKEDPVHFQTFINTASLFDFVFTTDLECIPRYQSVLGHDRVFLLPFACQPAHHHPEETVPRKHAISFAGAYYVRYPERTRDMDHFLQILPALAPVEIFDRNFGKNDPNYAFPAQYRDLIVGSLPLSDIDKAYKGYAFSLNLNSVKQSQTMFARRVFELLASNTITISNYSAGVRLLFGDLVLCSDNALAVRKSLESLLASPEALAKFRLTGLRKVMREHTAQDRLAWVVSRVCQRPARACLPRAIVLATVGSMAQLQNVRAHVARQHYPFCELVVMVPDDFQGEGPETSDGETWIRATEARAYQPDSGKGIWYCGMHAEDYYGPDYLVDLMLATRYSRADCIGKAVWYALDDAGSFRLQGDGSEYTRYASPVLHRSAVAAPCFEGHVLFDILTNPQTGFMPDQAFAIDHFSYCESGAHAATLASEIVDAPDPVHCGIAMSALLKQAQHLQPDDTGELSRPMLDGKAMLRWLKSTDPGVRFMANPAGLEILSSLRDGEHRYQYLHEDFELREFSHAKHGLDFHVEASTGLNVQPVLCYLNRDGKKIGHLIRAINANHTAALPDGTHAIRFGFRIHGAGRAVVRGIMLGHLPVNKPLVARHRVLLLTNHYPDSNDLYRNAFVHRRVCAYRKAGVAVDVFRHRENAFVRFHEHEDIDCITGSSEALDRLLAVGHYDTVLVHFLDSAMWRVLARYTRNLRIVVWVHGSEIQPLERRLHNYPTGDTRSARASSDQRMAFWRSVLRDLPENLHLVFVSNQFAQQALADLDISLPPSRYSVIHNPIETRLFRFVPKDPAQRMRVLSVRPYASRTYANDVMVQAILELSNYPEFADFEFLIVGDGVLFDETLAPLQGFPNVTIRRGFLTQPDIAQLHREYGLFLSPSRMDSQGVSRDEAMASGLVPLTSAAGAIPEFVDASCGIVAPLEDHHVLTEAMRHLYHHPDDFLRLSAAAAERVRNQSCVLKMIPRELALFAPDVLCGL